MSSSQPLVVVTRPLPEALLAPLQPLARLQFAEGVQDATLPAKLAEADYAISTAFEPMPAALLAQCTRLRAIANISVGFDHIDLAACTRQGILVSNTPEAVRESTADLAFALLMAAARRLNEADAFVRGGGWHHGAATIYGHDVHHATLGIVGLGRIGSTIARRARGFDMEVIYHSVDRLHPHDEQAQGVRFTSFDDLLSRSDFVVLQVPYLPATHHLIGARELARMKPSAVLVNAARGGVVDDEALADALERGTIAGAGLDVFEGEPRVNPRLRGLRNVLLSPHAGTNTRATHARMAQEAVSNLLEAMAGRVPPSCLNREALDARAR